MPPKRRKTLNGISEAIGPPPPVSALHKLIGLTITIVVLFILAMVLPWHQFDASVLRSGGEENGNLTITPGFDGGNMMAGSSEGIESHHFDWAGYKGDHLPKVHQGTLWIMFNCIVYSLVALALITAVWFGRLRATVVMVVLGIANARQQCLPC